MTYLVSFETACLEADGTGFGSFWNPSTSREILNKRKQNMNQVSKCIGDAMRDLYVHVGQQICECARDVYY